VQYAVQTGVQSLQRLCVTARDRKDVAINLHTVPVIGPDGTTHGATLLLHDASSETSLEERCQALHEKATRDPLTGVANRAEFDRVHEQFVAAHVERGLPCSLIITDIDHFKSVNDTYGHQVGDDVLVGVARTFLRCARVTDVVARYGGEEFVLVLEHTDTSGAAHLAERIRRSIGAQRYDTDLGPLEVTASFGVASLTDHADDAGGLLKAADDALYRAKEKGRNRVVIAPVRDRAEEQPVGGERASETGAA
jgi:diguanylate cyclase (GGDEF)-like protein